MGDGLFKDFLKNPETFRACEEFWERLTTGIAASLDQSGQWRQWEPRTYAGGKPFPKFMKGNPIHDGRSDRLDRAFKIIQDRATKNRYVLTAWITSCDLEFREVPRDTLVIGLTLSEDTARLAEKLLRKWMTPETTVEEMKAFIDEHVPKKADAYP